MVRIKDVAQSANVSSATVSRVLSNKGQIRDSTREKVLEAINTLGYKPSRVARSLRVRSSQIIGLIISDIQNPFFTSLVRAVEDVAHQNGYAIFLCNSDEHIEKEALYIDLMIAEHHVSWGSIRAFPFPEIYNTQGANAQQWYRIALYKYLVYGGRMEFRGSLAQYTACEQERDPITGQLPPDCIGTNNTVEAAHTRLLLWLSSDPYDRVRETLQWKSDIMWYEGIP